MVTSVLIIKSKSCIKLFAQTIKLRAQFSDHTIKNFQLDNASEFTYQSFDNYCMSIGISVEHLVAHVHTIKWFIIIIYRMFAINCSATTYES